MACKIIWSFEATADLNAVAEYISRDSAFYAASFVEEILTASRSLIDVIAEVPNFIRPTRALPQG